MSPITNFPQHPPDKPFPRLIQLVNPAAGAEIIYPCPLSHRFEILGFHFTLTASAVVANRNVDLVVSQGVTQLFRWDFNLVHPANFPYDYHLIPGRVAGAATIGFTRWFPGPISLPFFYGQTLFTDTTNLDVGDQFSLIYLYAYGWPDFVNNPPA